jgi:hypothetical protein
MMRKASGHILTSGAGRPRGPRSSGEHEPKPGRTIVLLPLGLVLILAVLVVLARLYLAG